MLDISSLLLTIAGVTESNFDKIKYQKFLKFEEILINKNNNVRC